MGKTDGKGDEKFQARFSIWQPDVPLAQLDAEHFLQSPYARDHLEGCHMPPNVLDFLAFYGLVPVQMVAIPGKTTFALTSSNPHSSSIRT